MQAVVIVIVWGSQCDGNSDGGNASGDLENFGCAVITNQLQTLTRPSQIGISHCWHLLRFHGFHVLVAAVRPRITDTCSFSPFPLVYARGRYALIGRFPVT